MENLNQNFLFKPFTHIYIEKEAVAHVKAKRLLEHFPASHVIEINHYKDVFNRSRQNYYAQKHAPSLILAMNHGTLIYPGAPVCQNFGNHNFYYTSSVLNCIYDCEYCYLQGMYPSANLVVFLNLEDIFYEVELLLQQHSVYLCISYDTDLLALEGLLGYCKEWLEFCRRHPSLTIELRTKSAGANNLSNLLKGQTPPQNFILAWTLSPEKAINRYEHRTPSLTNRLLAIRSASDAGWQIRLCFDPLLLFPDWADVYQFFFRTVFEFISSELLYDISLGGFRISAEYMKRMRKNRPDSALVQFPFQNINGVMTYGQAAQDQTLYLKKILTQYVPESKIFCWGI